MSIRLTHSYSALELFDNCPLRYFKQRISKEIKDEGGEASKHGERVHLAFEQRLRDKEPLPTYLEKHEPLCKAIEGLGGILSAEGEFVLNEDLKPTGWKELDAWLRAKIDVCVIKGTKAVVIDWKTGKRKPKFFQLELYALLVFIFYPEVTKVNAGFVWLQDGTTDKEIYTRDQFDFILGKLQKKIAVIEQTHAEEVWPAKPGPLCNWCPAKTTCLFAKTDNYRRR